MTALDPYADEYPEPVTGKPVWLMTLADLALLLVGFFVFVQASQHLDGKALARGIRSGFGAASAAAPPAIMPVDPMPVAAAAMLDFTPGSATLPSSPDGLIAWAHAVTRDPRVTLKVAGGTDGSPADVDALTGSGAVLAADRARAVAATLAEAHAVPAGRMTITGAASGRRSVVVTLAFSGSLSGTAPAPVPTFLTPAPDNGAAR